MAPQAKVLVLDLDHTILHMLKQTDMPSNDAGFAEDVVYFSYLGVDYAVALRVGTTSLVRAMRSAGVKVVVATCNLVAEKVMAALAARCNVFDKLDLHIIESREKGAKSLEAIGLAVSDGQVGCSPRFSRHHLAQVVIVDDSLSAWDTADQESVLEARRYDVLELAVVAEEDEEDADDRLDAELGYLTQTREDLLAIFTTPAIDWTSSASSPALKFPVSRKRAAEASTILQTTPTSSLSECAPVGLSSVENLVATDEVQSPQAKKLHTEAAVIQSSPLTQPISS